MTDLREKVRHHVFRAMRSDGDQMQVAYRASDLIVALFSDRIAELEAAIETNTKALGFAQNARCAADARVAALEAALKPFAEIGTPKHPGKRHTSPIYGLELQSGTGELRLYSPFSDTRAELPMLTADFHRAAKVYASEETAGGTE